MDIQNTGQVDAYSRFRMDRTEGRPAVNNVSGSSTQAASAAPKSDSVTLSDEGVLRTEAYRVALNGSPVRQEKVDAIKAQIEDGTYTIDSKRIATKMLGEEIDIMG